MSMTSAISAMNLMVPGITVPALSSYPITEVDGYEMAEIPGGCTVIGSANVYHATPRWVHLSPYAIGRRLVSWDESVSQSEYPSNFPVTDITWNAAKSYSAERGLTLPTEAQWENAARGPAVDIRAAMAAEEVDFSMDKLLEFVDGRFENFVFGALGMIFTNPKNDLFRELVEQGMPFFGWRIHATPSGSLSKDAVWFSRGGPTSVDWGLEGPYGVYGMAGNVWEWTADAYEPHPTAAFDPVASGLSSIRTIRGGAWNDIQPSNLRAGMRQAQRAIYGDNNIGFRMAAPREEK